MTSMTMRHARADWPRIAAAAAFVAVASTAWFAPARGQGAGATPQPAPLPVTPEEAGEAPTEWYAWHVQSTFTQQFSPGFPARFGGSYSLSPAAFGRETFDATAFLGVRPWDGAELWWNPEIDQGFGLQNTLGVAGFVSGEAYKVGKKDPYLLQDRLFLRQTIDLGGEAQKVDADLNQLAGTQTADRVVITLGKFSVVDVFDTNTYAHDPRNDFLNWSVIDSGTFDYAANSWGYTYGASVELYAGDYAARIGAFNLSVTPNSLNVDPRVLGQFQLIGEVEQDHTLWSLPGKLKVLYWISRGELGGYDDAIAQGITTGTAPNTASVRSYHSKDGVELNLEQQVAAGIGVFFRGGLSQGNVEADDFTDINRSVLIGTQVMGDQWGRPDDTVGAAFVANEVSHDGKRYFAAGGLGVLVGDGALPNAGPEQIFETYYSLGVFEKIVHVTADYQFVNHPAYNRDRGPVNVLGLRLHVQF